MRRYHVFPVLAFAAFFAASPAYSQSRPSYSAADVEFIQRMIGHHAQAIVMSKLAVHRTTRPDILTAARRITVSQRDEIALMQRWLSQRGEHVPAFDTIPPGTAADSMAGMPMVMIDHNHQMAMPGMLTREQLVRLANVKGAQFESLYLKDMIAHHEGALTMVAKLFATPGAGQESQIFQLASGIDSDQSAEIARMQTMQRTRHLPKKRPRS